ncbi:hypothetical protein FIBSPDRAFT_926506 [Athelia psychrophila]|uniref:Uncharacterized protein n=1 Tax=Athelia psychrophila TaxID=1759441 RepID=A0A166T875_9AGAM|nr:hypothetical protein FIBSPDRAFT_926506 [Fibularhizoctonia sp. CBS 109695]
MSNLIISSPIAIEDMPLMLESYAVSGTWLNRPVFQTVRLVPKPPCKDSLAVRCFKKARAGKKGKGVVATRPTPLLADCGQDSSSVNPKIAYHCATDIDSPTSSTDTLVNVSSFDSLDSIYDLYSKTTDTVLATTDSEFIDQGIDDDSSYGVGATIDYDYSLAVCRMGTEALWEISRLKGCMITDTDRGPGLGSRDLRMLFEQLGTRADPAFRSTFQTPPFLKISESAGQDDQIKSKSIQKGGRAHSDTDTTPKVWNLGQSKADFSLICIQFTVTIGAGNRGIQEYHSDNSAQALPSLSTHQMLADFSYPPIVKPFIDKHTNLSGLRRSTRQCGRAHGDMDTAKTLNTILQTLGHVGACIYLSSRARKRIRAVCYCTARSAFTSSSHTTELLLSAIL